MKTNRDTIIKSGIYKKGEINLEQIIASIMRNHNIEEAGSIHTFTGIVRNSSKVGKPVVGMKIDAYNELANKSIQKICDRLNQEKGILDVIIIHFKGEFDISEEVVHVVVASAHRQEGFDTISKAVDMYKQEIAVWKRENYSNGLSEWIH